MAKIDTEWQDIVPPQYLSIFEKFLPEWADMFTTRSQDYGDAYKLLGAKGQFSDINRKFWKLKNAIWDGQKMNGEQVPEILNDIISHCFLMMMCLEEGI